MLKILESNKIQQKKNKLLENELNEAHLEIEKLLKIVHELEKNKNNLNTRLYNNDFYETKNSEESSTNLLKMYINSLNFLILLNCL